MAATIEDKDLKMEREVKEFQQLCSQYTKSTANIRTFSGHWSSGVANVPGELRNEVGRIVSFLQDKVNKQGKINNELFCTKDQCLMIYNFQAWSSIPLFIFWKCEKTKGCQ